MTTKWGVWREFDEVDWFGLAGAESFPGGEEPLVAYIRVDGLETEAVLDARGIGLMSMTPDGETVGYFNLANGAPYLARFATTLRADYEMGDLIDMGFDYESGEGK